MLGKLTNHAYQSTQRAISEQDIERHIRITDQWGVPQNVFFLVWDEYGNAGPHRYIEPGHTASRQ